MGKIFQFVLIIHEVEDYTTWKQVFDAAAGIRKEAGEISYRILRFDDDPNKIVHFSRWLSHRNARRFFESDDLIRIREKAGVKQPRFIYLDQLENGIL
jgi:quinol monooxygenase YgiN